MCERERDRERERVCRRVQEGLGMSRLEGLVLGLGRSEGAGVCIYVYMYTCIYVYMYICIYVYMYTCIYVYMYLCMFVKKKYIHPCACRPRKIEWP